MTLPIAEYLAAKHGKEVKGEVNHPLFKTESRGRPKQIDFVRMRAGENAWLSAYECKFSTLNQALIVQDLCRLVCLSQSRETIGTPDRFFLYSGEMKDGSLLKSSQFNTGEGERRSFFGGLLSEDRDDPNISFRIDSLHPNQRRRFIEFAKANKAKLPSVVESHLSGWAVSGKIACAIWRVTQSRGSILLSSEQMCDE